MVANISAVLDISTFFDINIVLSSSAVLSIPAVFTPLNSQCLDPAEGGGATRFSFVLISQNLMMVAAMVKVLVIKIALTLITIVSDMCHTTVVVQGGIIDNRHNSSNNVLKLHNNVGHLQG